MYINKTYKDINKPLKVIENSLFKSNGTNCNSVKLVLFDKDLKNILVPKKIKNLQNKIKKNITLNANFKNIIEKYNLKPYYKFLGDNLGIQRFNLNPSLFFENFNEENIFKTEIFGPLLFFLEVNNSDEIFNIVDKSKFGISFTIFTKEKDIKKYFDIKVGRININKGPIRCFLF